MSSSTYQCPFCSTTLLSGYPIGICPQCGNLLGFIWHKDQYVSQSEYISWYRERIEEDWNCCGKRYNFVTAKYRTLGSNLSPLELEEFFVSKQVAGTIKVLESGETDRFFSEPVREVVESYQYYLPSIKTAKYLDRLGMPIILFLTKSEASFLIDFAKTYLKKGVQRNCPHCCGKIEISTDGRIICPLCQKQIWVYHLRPYTLLEAEDIVQSESYQKNALAWNSEKYHYSFSLEQFKNRMENSFQSVIDNIDFFLLKCRGQKFSELSYQIPTLECLSSESQDLPLKESSEEEAIRVDYVPQYGKTSCIQTFESSALHVLTSPDMVSIRNRILVAYDKLSMLVQTSEKLKKQYEAYQKQWYGLKFFLSQKFSLFPQFKAHMQQLETKQNQAVKQLKNYHLNINIQMKPVLEDAYKRLQEAFSILCRADKIWDIIRMENEQPHIMEKSEVYFGIHQLPIMQCRYDVLFLQNANGASIYLYPGFLVLDQDRNVAVINVKDIQIISSELNVPDKTPSSDAVRTGRTWQYINNDGTPDKRFKLNPEIPLVSYLKIEMKSSTGLNECYLISDKRKGTLFAEAFCKYQQALRNQYIS